MVTHSSSLAGIIPWAEESGRLHTVHRVARVRHGLATKQQKQQFLGVDLLKGISKD